MVRYDRDLTSVGKVRGTTWSVMTNVVRYDRDLTSVDKVKGTLWYFMTPT